MVILIAGASHTGKTLLAQRLLERYGFPYLSLDHLKMGLIRSGQTPLTPFDDDEMTAYLWPIAREMAKTAIENGQNLIIEGCYIPFDWQDGFDARHLSRIRYVCLALTPEYIERHWDRIIAHEGAIERRLPGDAPEKADLIAENRANIEQCRIRGFECLAATDEYRMDFAL